MKRFRNTLRSTVIALAVTSTTTGCSNMSNSQKAFLVIGLGLGIAAIVVLVNNVEDERRRATDPNNVIGNLIP